MALGMAVCQDVNADQSIHQLTSILFCLTSPLVKWFFSLTVLDWFVFVFCAFVLFADHVSRHRRDDLWLCQLDIVPELVSHEQSSALP